jgi:hypothetical protein
LTTPDHGRDHCCYFNQHQGRREPGYHVWQGMQAADKQSDRIGMLLDLDRGSMTVYKNSERLGVMQAGASHLCVLSGEYVWAVVLEKDRLASTAISRRVRVLSPRTRRNPQRQKSWRKLKCGFRNGASMESV